MRKSKILKIANTNLDSILKRAFFLEQRSESFYFSWIRIDIELNSIQRIL